MEARSLLEGRLTTGLFLNLYKKNATQVPQPAKHLVIGVDLFPIARFPHDLFGPDYLGSYSEGRDAVLPLLDGYAEVVSLL